MPSSQITLHKRQTEANLSKKQFIFCVTGLQAGKTTLGAIWLMREIAKDPYADYLIVANNHAVLTSGTMLKFEELAPDGAFKFYADRAKYWYKINQDAFGLPNDPKHGHIFVRTAAHPNSIVSMTVKAAWFDEAGDSPRAAWNNLQGRVRIHKGRILCTSTPYNFNWLKDAVEMAQNGEPTYDYFNFPSYMNKFFDMNEFLQAQRTYPREDFERLYMGLFTRPQNVIYDSFKSDEMMISDEEYREWSKLDPVKETIAGVDWGWNDPTVMVVINIHESGMYALVDEFYEKKVSNRDLVEAAKHFKTKYKIKYFYADNARPELINEFQHTKWTHQNQLQRLTTIGVTKTPTSRSQTYVEEGTNVCRQKMINNEFRVLHRCANVKRALGSYRWKTGADNDGQRLLNTPDHYESDAMDAMRYAIHSHTSTKPVLEVVQQVPDDLLSRFQQGLLKPNKGDIRQAFFQDGLS